MGNIRVPGVVGARCSPTGSGECGSSAVLYRTGRCVHSPGFKHGYQTPQGAQAAPGCLLGQHCGQLRWVRPWHMPADPVEGI